jgi:hypothetical protein
MGRYAFFNTGYEYKFAFAVQGGEDIQQFGGQDVSTSYELAHSWSPNDIETIREELRDYEEHYDIKFPKVEDFPKTEKGTWQISNAMYELNKKTGNWSTYYTAVLGLLILHQLQYEPDLHAHYEG